MHVFADFFSVLFLAENFLQLEKRTVHDYCDCDMWSNAFHYVWLCQDVVHTAKNSLLSTISFPSASNMLNAILKPAWGSEVRQKSTTSSPFILLTNQILIIIIDTFCQRSVQIYTYLLKCRAGRGTLCNLGHLKKKHTKRSYSSRETKTKMFPFPHKTPSNGINEKVFTDVQSRAAEVNKLPKETVHAFRQE